MLNKNQSKKRNSWKYYVVIPALAAFILLFQIEVIAKEKPQIIKMENESNIKSIDVYKIRKNTTDAELNEIKNNLQKDHNVKFEVSEIKRNDSNQLTSIIVDVKKGKQRAKSMQNSDNAINEFGVLVITYNNGDKKIGIQTVNDSHSKKSKNAVSKSISTANADTEDDSKKSSNYQIIVTQNKNSNTDTNVNINSSISTKTNSNTNTNSSTFVTTNVNDDVTTITTSSDAKPRIVVSNKSNTDLNGNTLIIVDGKVMPEDFDLEDLKPNQIKTMSVYKGIKATAKYGEKGKDGVIEIETHK